jgi:hypothetical protein
MARNLFQGQPTVTGNRWNPWDLVIAGLDDDSGPEHPLFDEGGNKEPVRESLVRVIEKLGFIGSVIGKKYGKAEHTRVFVQDGRQRVKAARAAWDRAEDKGDRERYRVKVLYEDGTDADLMGIVAASNEHRRNVPIMEKARAASALKRAGETNQDIADVFGVSITAVQKWLDMLSLDPSVQKAIEDGKVPGTSALKVTKDLPLDEQAEVMKEVTKGGDGKKVTAKKIQKAKAKVAKKRGKKDNVQIKLGKKDIKGILDEAVLTGSITQDFVSGALWAIGELAGEESPVKTATERWIERGRVPAVNGDIAKQEKEINKVVERSKEFSDVDLPI